MPVTERLMKTGQWSLKLSDQTPKAIRDLLGTAVLDGTGYFGHVFVFDSQMRAGLSDATMLATSRWGGIVRRRPTPWDVGGGNMIAWLGDEDGKGPILRTLITGAPNTFAQFVTAFLAQCPAVTAGTVAGAIGGTSGSAYQWITARAALDNCCTIFQAEYRVNKDATLDYAAVGSTLMFQQTPTAVAMRRSSGRDLNLTGISVTHLGISIDSEEYIVDALLQDVANGWYAGVPAATPYKDLKGNLIKMDKIVTPNPHPPAANSAALATTLATAGQVLRNEVTLSTDEFDIDRDVAVGDWIYVYDQDSNMVDVTNQVRYRGSVIFPIKLRVLATTWPIERGMAVWYRDKNAVWTDLSNFVVWEQPGATFEVGAASRALLTTP